jgi:phosphoglycerate kinase
VPKQTIRDLDFQGKKALVRVDFNVPQAADGDVADDRRIRAALPTLRYILDHGGALILVSHLGRPEGDPAKDQKFRLDAVARRLGELLGLPVRKVNDTVGPEAQAAAAALEPGGVLVLENVRFNKGEKVPKKDEATGQVDAKALERHQEFARQLAGLADVYVNDAFGTCHRDEASMVAVPEQFPPERRGIGFLVEKEVATIDRLLRHPERPMVAILGGAKVSTKFGLIENLLPRVDKLLIGGAMSYTFLLAEGRKVGNSLVEPDWVDKAGDLKARAGTKLELPRDYVLARKAEPGAETRVVEAGQAIPEGWEGFDIGPKTAQDYGAIIRGARTVVWNGPMGKFEVSPFDAGTRAVAQAVAECPGVTAVGGGETAEAIEKFGLADRINHVSTGGGAFLEALEGAEFNSLRVIPDR